MTDRHHILLVDDDLMMTELERHQLGEEQYRFSTASNGLDALARIAADKPEVILLDVVMPELDGLETCRRIRADDEYADIHIIFVTSKDDEATRLTAYEAGGDDVLTKPLNAAVINRKVEAAINSRLMVRELQDEVASTMGILMSTIATSGEYGVVMNFFRSSYACSTVAELAEVVLKALDDFCLTGSVQLRSGDYTLTLNTERRSSPIEQEMLLKLSVGNRHIYDYGSRTAFCYPHVAILIKSMPLDDAESYGRIKDNIALLAEGAEFRLKALQVEIAVNQQRKMLLGSVAQVTDVLDRINVEYKSGQSAMTNIFGELETRLEWVFAGLGLSDGQESGIWQIVRPLISESSQLYEKGVDLDSQLNVALDALRASLDKPGLNKDEGRRE
jgi:DNA-binding response OmpR family regulator